MLQSTTAQTGLRSYIGGSPLVTVTSTGINTSNLDSNYAIAIHGDLMEIDKLERMTNTKSSNTTKTVHEGSSKLYWIITYSLWLSWLTPQSNTLTKGQQHPLQSIPKQYSTT